MNDDINIYKEQEEENAREMLQAMKETSDAHKIDEPEEEIKKTEYITECQKCGQSLFLGAKGLSYEEMEAFGCGWKIIRLDGHYLCNECLVNILWEQGKQNLTLKGVSKMEDTKNLIIKEQGQELAKILTPETIKKYICPNATQQEIFMFLQIAKMYQLNPFKREIYLVKYADYPAQNVVGYETYLKRADRTGNWSGMKVWTEGEIPQLIAKIEINRKGWDKPFYHEVEYAEYVQHKKDGSITKFWKEKPKTMLKKVVVSQAFRMAFPDEFGGMPYTMEEMPIEIEKLPTEEVKIEEHKEPIKEETPQPIKTDEPSKPANFLNVEQALKAQKAETLEGVMGLLQIIKERQTKTKKDITDYTITSMDGNSKMMISTWSKAHEGVNQGQVVIFKGITIGEFRNALQYTAKEIEIVGHNKLEE